MIVALGALLRAVDVGCFAEKIRLPWVSAAQRQAVPEGLPMFGETRMKNARLKATSEVLAQLMAVAAMLIIAGFIFYGGR